MIQVGIVGGAGYTAGELFRLLINHPEVEINFVYSTSNAGNFISDVHQDLTGSTEMRFTDTIDANVDILFLCLGHSNSKSFLDSNSFSPATKIIDLSNDFRLSSNREITGKKFVYGLPEVNRDKIRKANYIANPGCFATAIQLALLPLIKESLVEKEVHIQGITGCTGAGSAWQSTTQFTWRDNNISWYKPFIHQHLDEIKETFQALSKTPVPGLQFMPYRGNFSRGIFITLYTEYQGSIDNVKNLYKNFYSDHPFTIISDKEIHLKQVVNTNKCFLHLHQHEGKILVTSCIDNLLKGAAGQAVQNMNLMFGFPETSGLILKGNLF